MIYNGITTSVAGSSYSLTVEPAVSTLKNGDVLIVTFHEASPKDPALIIGGNPIPIKNRTGKVFYMGDIKKNMVMTLGYNKTDNCFYTSETLVSGKRLQDIEKKNTAHPESIMYSHDTNEFANGDKTKSDFTMKMHELAGDIISSNYFVHDKAGLDIVVGDPKIKEFVLKNGYRITILFLALPKANFSIKLHDTPAIPGGDESFQKLITIDSYCEFEYNETANKWFLMRDSLYLLRTGTTPMEGDLDMNDKIIKKAKIDKPEITGGTINDTDINGAKLFRTKSRKIWNDRPDIGCDLVMEASNDGKSGNVLVSNKQDNDNMFFYGYYTNPEASGAKSGDFVKFQHKDKRAFIYGKEIATQEYVDARFLSVGIYIHADWANVKAGWMYADGRTLPPSYTEYYKEYPDGKVLDARGRFLLGEQSGVYGRRGKGGSSVHPLTLNEIASHTHSWNKGLEGDDAGTGGSHAEFTMIPGNLNPTPIGNSGGNAPHNNMPPFLVLPCFVYVGLNTLKATEPLAIKMIEEDGIRVVRRKSNEISKFHYLSGLMEFFSDSGKKITFYEEEVSASIKLNEILEPLKYEKNLCTILFDTNEEKARANKMIVRVNFDEFITSETQLDFKLQDKIQEILNKTSFEELVSIKEDLVKKAEDEQNEKIKLELEKWEQENPLEYLKRQKIEEVNTSILQKVSARTFSESRSILQKKNELMDYISMQNDIETLKTLNVSDIINQR